MDLLFCLEGILSDFRHLFNQQNFALFQAFIFGFIANNGRGTLTELYQSSASETQYWSFPKFLSRGQWNADAVAALLIRRIQNAFRSWVYVYDETKALKTGKSQWGLHFFRNYGYQKHRVNQSKFHYGHEFGALGLLCQTPTSWLLFPVWVKLIVPQTIRDKSFALMSKVCAFISGEGSHHKGLTSSLAQSLYMSQVLLCSSVSVQRYLGDLSSLIVETSHGEKFLRWH